MTEEQPRAAFVTFYSFKGGVGRSMALINTAAMLASRGFRVLVLDLDLEAPGLSYLDPQYSGSEPVYSSTGERITMLCQPGFVDLMLDAAQNGTDADLFSLSATQIATKYTREYVLPTVEREFDDGSLHIMPAGLLTSDYAQRFDTLNLRGLYQDGLGEPLIRLFKQKLSESKLYDYVLIDSRTGFSDEAGICTRDLADHLMILSGLNRQNVQGTSEFLAALRSATGGTANIQIILSPVPNGEDKLLEQREAFAKRSFENAWGTPIDLSLQIPYHPQLSLTEDPHIFRRRSGYLFEAYSAIERSMLHALGHDASTLRVKIKESLTQQDYGGALRHLRFLVRLPNGKTSLSNILAEMLYSPRLAFRKVESEVSAKHLSLGSLINNTGGVPVVEFLVSHIPLNQGEYLGEVLLGALEKLDVNIAEKLHHRIIQERGGDAKSLCDYAHFLHAYRNDSEKAREIYQSAIDAAPNNADALGDFAVFLASQELLDQADAMYKRAIDAGPDDARNVGNYAIFLMNQRAQFNTAKEYFERAIRLEPENSDILGGFANLLCDHLGDFKNAELFYKRAISIDPKDADNLGNYALFLATQKEDLALADSMFKRAVNADRTNTFVLQNYADFLIKRGEYEHARDVYEQALEAAPDDASIFHEYANLLSDHIKAYDLAEAAYKRAISLAPASVQYRVDFGLFLGMQKNDMTTAHQVFGEAIRIAPDDANTWAKYAMLLSTKTDNLSLARKMFERSLTLDPSHGRTLSAFAIFHWENLHDRNAARLYFKRALVADPSDELTVTSYAAFLADVDELDEAEAQFRTALAKGNISADTLALFGDFLERRKNNYVESADSYRKALEKNPNSGQILSRYAHVVAFLLKKPAEARSLYDRAIKLAPDDVNLLGDYAQVLISLGELDKAQEVIHLALQKVTKDEEDERAELFLISWILARLLREPGDNWLLQFAESLRRGFSRRNWNFDLVMERARTTLDQDDLKFALSMIDAFLDEQKASLFLDTISEKLPRISHASV